MCAVRSRQLSDVDMTIGHGTGCRNEQHELTTPTIISLPFKLDAPLRNIFVSLTLEITSRNVQRDTLECMVYCVPVR